MSIEFKYDKPALDGTVTFTVHGVDIDTGQSRIERRFDLASDAECDAFAADVAILLGDPRCADDVKAAMKKQRAAAIGGFVGDPIPLDSPPPPDLPTGVLPQWLGAHAEAVALATETPSMLSELMHVGVVAIACQRAFTVMPEPGYYEPVNVWPFCALEPGNRKTAVFKLAFAPLLQWERKQAADFEPIIKKAQSERRTREGRIKALRKQADKADAADLPALLQQIEQEEADLPEIPMPPRVLQEDITPEHLATMMSRNHECGGIGSDEGGIVDLMGGRYSKNGDANLDIFLKGYSSSHVRVDRGSREPIAMDHPRLSIVLCPQPEVIRGMLARPGFKGRGLLDRPLWGLPASNLGDRQLKPHPVLKHVSDAYAKGIMELLDTPMASSMNDKPVPHVLKLSRAIIYFTHQSC